MCCWLCYRYVCIYFSRKKKPLIGCYENNCLDVIWTIHMLHLHLYKTTTNRSFTILHITKRSFFWESKEKSIFQEWSVILPKCSQFLLPCKLTTYAHIDNRSRHFETAHPVLPGILPPNLQIGTLAIIFLSVQYPGQRYQQDILFVNRLFDVKKGKTVAYLILTVTLRRREILTFISA